MNLILNRSHFLDDGIFGELVDETGNQLMITLEHSYDGKPKLTQGTYECVRGPHRLHGMESDFITFEVTQVPGHTGILFHIGNYNEDSEGCILLGLSFGNKILGGKMICSSKQAFDQFMKMQEGVDNFTLIVRDCE